MKTGMFNLRHRARVGPGGWHCTCCSIAPKNRRAAARKLKKQLYRSLNRFDNTEAG